MKMKKVLVFVLTCIMALSTSIMTASAAEVETTNEDPYSGAGSYMACFQIQTTTWVYRNYFEDPTTGYGTDIFKTVYNNETSAATSTVINDTVIDGDGEYTISLTNTSLEGSTDFNMVGISTNIPLDAGIEITAASLKYGTKEITSAFAQKNDNKKNVHIMLINQYDNDMKDTVNTLVPADGTDMIITFTVAGFGYEKTVVEEAVTETPVEVTQAPVADATATTDVTTEASSDAATDEEASNDKLPVGLIIGIASVAIVAIIVFVIFKKKKKA